MQAFPTIMALAMLWLCPAAAVAAERIDQAAVRAWLQAMQGATAGGIVSPAWDAQGSGFRYRDADGRTWRVQPETATRTEYFAIPEDPARPIVRRMFPMNDYDRRESKSPDGTWMLTLDGPNIALRHSDGSVWKLRDDGTDRLAYFPASDIWEDSGPAWSPDGTRLVFRAHDMTGVRGIAWLDTRPDGEVVNHFRYWGRTGEPLPQTQFLMADTQTQRVVPVATPSGPDHYLFFLDWRPDGRAIALLRVARDLSEFVLLEADVATGLTRTLHREAQPGGMVRWPSGRNFRYLADGGYLWRSNQAGHFAWYHHRADGRRAGIAATAAFDLGEIVHIDDRGRLHLMAGPDPARPFDSQLLRFESPRRFTRLTQEPGVHAISFSPDGTHFVSSHHDLSRPPSADLHRADGSLLLRLDQAKLSPQRALLPAPEPFVSRGADGRPVHGIILKPPGFDPARRYPVIERIYGGMQSSVVPRGWLDAGGAYRRTAYHLTPLWYQSQGFVVVLMDSSGTPGLGRAHHVARFGIWPDGIIADHVTALDTLASTRPWMDLDRLGVDGHSWGGMLALRALIEAPDRYKAAVSAVPQTDMLDHVSWSEFQLGNATTNRTAYERAALAPLAHRIQSPLLIAAGDADVNVPISNSLRLMAALNAAGVPYRYLPLPGTNHAHRLADGTDLSPVLLAESTNFFREHLGQAK